MELKMGDTIYIKGFINEDPEFHCWKHMKDLIGFPTKVCLIRNNKIYVTHPILDVVNFNEDCVNYEVIDNGNLIHNKKLNEEEQEELKLNKVQEKLLRILNKFQNGDIDVDFIENAIGGLDKFFNLLTKNNLLGYIDPFSSDWDDYQNQLFYLFYENDSSFVWTIVDKFISDVTKIGNDYYFDTSPAELSGFFETGYRSEMSRDTIESILQGEHDMNFWDVTDDVYRDVYTELKNENKQLVNERIVLELRDMKTIGTDTELLKEIAREQGRNDVELTDDVISRVLGDDDTIEYLINKELYDVRSDLYSLYQGCYEGVLTEEWYKSLMGELIGSVIDNGEIDDYSYKKQSFDKDGNKVSRTFYGTRYKATNCIYNVVSEWLNDNKDCNGTYCDTIIYFGSYERLYSDLIDDGGRESLKVPRLDEYPNYREVNSCVNRNIGDYF
jgi:hypothetical protein